MAVATRCQTPGAVFHTRITPEQVSVVVDLPAPLDLSRQDAELLESNVHNAIELALTAVWGQR